MNGLIVVSLALAFIYRFGPSRDKPKWRWIIWGSALAALTWLVGSILFAWYTQNFGSYNKTYGSLGAVVGFMTWIWLSAIVILIGAELDTEMERQTVRGTTEGIAKPMRRAPGHSWPMRSDRRRAAEPHQRLCGGGADRADLTLC